MSEPGWTFTAGNWTVAYAGNYAQAAFMDLADMIRRGSFIEGNDYLGDTWVLGNRWDVLVEHFDMHEGDTLVLHDTWWDVRRKEGDGDGDDADS